MEAEEVTSIAAVASLVKIGLFLEGTCMASRFKRRSAREIHFNDPRRVPRGADVGGGKCIWCLQRIPNWGKKCFIRFR